ncbi:MAG: hypothetical protein JXR29_13140 [Methylothermaceae bacterium]|nr:hypothetical protein [Methylothermaceae bacterium]
MELWKIHRFCQGASLDQLLRAEQELVQAINEEKVSDTNAAKTLELLREYIELKRIFRDVD